MIYRTVEDSPPFYGGIIESKPRGRKRSYPESPAPRTRLIKLPTAEANVKAQNYALALDEPHHLLSYETEGNDPFVTRINYCNSFETPNAGLHYRRNCYAAESPRPSSRVEPTNEEIIAETLGESSWSYAVYGLVSVLAGHMWQFCKKSAFRGFRAGGGIGFGWKGKDSASAYEKDERPAVQAEDDNNQMDLVRADRHGVAQDLSSFANDIDIRDCGTADVPYASITASLRTKKDTPCRASKRQQIDNDGAWVVISHFDGYGDSYQAGSKLQLEPASGSWNRTRKPHFAGGGDLRPCSCCGSRSRSRSRPRPRSRLRPKAHASSHYLQSRSPQYHQYAGHSSPSAFCGSPIQSERHFQEHLTRTKQGQVLEEQTSLSINSKPARSSLSTMAVVASHTPLRGLRATASMDFDTIARKRARPRVSPASVSGSPLSADARRYQMRQRREERRAEASIQKVNDRLKDMIREGREALNSEIHVDDDGDREEW